MDKEIRFLTMRMPPDYYRLLRVLTASHGRSQTDTVKLALEKLASLSNDPLVKIAKAEFDSNKSSAA